MTTTTTLDTAREGIARANAEFMNAFGRGDAAGVAASYTADALLMPPQSDFIGGAAAIEAFWRGAMDAGFTGVRLATQELTEMADGALEVGRWSLTMGDGQVADEGKYMVAWRRTAEGWRLHRDIWNSSRPPAA